MQKLSFQTLLGLLLAGSACAQPAAAPTPAAALPVTSSVAVDLSRLNHRFQGRDDVQTTLSLRSALALQQPGELQLQVQDQATGRVVLRAQQQLTLAAGASTPVDVTLPARPGMLARIGFVAAGSAGLVNAPEASFVVPYLLTPPDADTPALHGARVWGARPGTPLQHRVPATGLAPLRFEAQGLPAGLVLDSATGIISGTVPAAGRHTVPLTVSNAQGSAERDWTLVAGEQLVLTPPMGWASWLAHGLQVGEAQVRAASLALLDLGLAAKGWNLVQLDDGWQAAQRLPDGSLPANTRFPSMPSLAQHLHARGQQFGLYASPGATGCGGLPGSWRFEAQDAATWAAWGVDHVKYDLCSATEQLPERPVLEDHQQPYRAMGQLLRQQPRSMAFALSQYGQHKVWTWGAEVGGHTWRMTGDIQDSWGDLLATGFAMAPYAGFVGPGRFNDPDVLMVGLLGPPGDGQAPLPTKLTPDEQYTQVSLWALLAAPLMLSNHLPALDEFTLNLLTNSEVININQDTLAQSAVRVLDRNGWQVWVKELERGARAVGVFNMGSRWARYELDPALFGRVGRPYQLRDAWRQRDWPVHTGPVALAVPAHGVALLTVW